MMPTPAIFIRVQTGSESDQILNVHQIVRFASLASDKTNVYMSNSEMWIVWMPIADLIEQIRMATNQSCYFPIWDARPHRGRDE